MRMRTTTTMILMIWGMGKWCPRFFKMCTFNPALATLALQQMYYDLMSLQSAELGHLRLIMHQTWFMR